MAFGKPFDFDLLRESPVDRVLRDSASERLALELAGQWQTPSAMDQISRATQGLIDFQTIRVATEAHKTLADFARAYGGIGELARTIAAQRDALLAPSEMLAAYEPARMAQWATALASPNLPDLAAFYRDRPTLLTEAEKLLDQIRASFVGGISDRVSVLKATLELPEAVKHLAEATSVKMSIFSGIEGTIGFGNQAFAEARYSLLGDWRTNFELPRSFWQDRRVRERHYRQADVDPGIVAVPPAVAVEIMVESGFALGDSDENGTVALFAFGGLSVAIRSNAAEIDAHRAIVSFERRLRAFVAEKLEAHAGSKWFKQRVHGDIHLKAKATREAALRLGEQPAALIDYTEFGELKEIVLQRNNWDDVFGSVFINRERFDQDMITLLAIRRPTAHARVVDATQMVEALFVMRRLDAQMINDGGWIEVAASDE
jgi:hypothetical protein